MTYRGTVKNGVIVLEGDAALPDGTAVEITALGLRDTEADGLPAFGLWRDRRDMRDPTKAARKLRHQVERRGKRG